MNLRRRALRVPPPQPSLCPSVRSPRAVGCGQSKRGEITKRTHIQIRNTRHNASGAAKCPRVTPTQSAQSVKSMVPYEALLSARASAASPNESARRGLRRLCAAAVPHRPSPHVSERSDAVHPLTKVRRFRASGHKRRRRWRMLCNVRGTAGWPGSRGSFRGDRDDTTSTTEAPPAGRARRSEMM